MSNNSHGLDEEEVEQDEMLAKLNLITISSAKNLETMNNSITSNETVGTTNTANFAMTNTSTLRTYAEATRTLANANQSAILGITSGLFSDAIKFTINGAFAIAGDGSLTGSSLSTTNPLTTTFRRYVLQRTDTYGSDITLSDSNTKFTPNESGTYLSIISYEFYDSAATTKTVSFDLIEGTSSTLQTVRATITGTGSGFEYHRVNNTMVVTLTAGTTYFYRAKSTNAGVINAFATTTNLTLIKMTKSF